MSWRYETHHRCFTTTMDGWRLLIQQTCSKGRWRAAVVPPPGGLARIASATFTSRTAARIWCLAARRQEQHEGAIGT